MTENELIDTAKREIENHVARVKAVAERAPEKMGQRTAAGEWSPYEIIEHLIISYDREYAPVINEAISRAQPADGTQEVKPSFLGKFLVRVAGPDGNAPVPKPFRPSQTTYGPEVLDRWVATMERAVREFESVRGKNLTGTKFRNPFAKMFKMNLTDWMLVTVAHTERHVRQIEERTR